MGVKEFVKKVVEKEEESKGSKSGGAGGRYTQIPTFEFPSYKRGGRVKRTGLARVHKGERILTRKQSRKRGKK